MPHRPYSVFHQSLAFLRYWISAKSGKGHGIHSPFIYSFVREVLRGQVKEADLERIEKLRARLKQDQRMVRLTDYGAGSVAGKVKERTVGTICRSAAKPARLAELLYRSVKFSGAVKVLELGTSLGLTTAYLAAANKTGTVISIEGDPVIASIARENLAALGVDNAEVRTGNFDEELPQLLNGWVPDLVYIDGNHRLDPTIQYFRQIFEVANADTMVIFDDIHWSAEMEMAWEQIRQHPAVSASVDLFFLGYVFFRKEFKEPVHFSIRF